MQTTWSRNLQFVMYIQHLWRQSYDVNYNVTLQGNKRFISFVFTFDDFTLIFGDTAQIQNLRKNGGGGGLCIVLFQLLHHRGKRHNKSYLTGLYINFFSYFSIRTSDQDINLSGLQLHLSKNFFNIKDQMLST